MPKQAVKPIFPLQHEFMESLKRYQGEVSMLLSVVETVLSMDDVVKLPPKVKANLRERCDALRAATHD